MAKNIRKHSHKTFSLKVHQTDVFSFKMYNLFPPRDEFCIEFKSDREIHIIDQQKLPEVLKYKWRKQDSSKIKKVHNKEK